MMNITNVKLTEVSYHIISWTHVLVNETYNAYYTQDDSKKKRQAVAKVMKSDAFLCCAGITATRQRSAKPGVGVVKMTFPEKECKNK